MLLILFPITAYTKQKVHYVAESIPLTLSEHDALIASYMPCWNATPTEDKSMPVSLYVTYGSNGALINATHDAEAKHTYMADPLYRATVESAMRAVRHPRCNPLKLPLGLIQKLNHTKITFDPRAML